MLELSNQNLEETCSAIYGDVKHRFRTGAKPYNSKYLSWDFVGLHGRGANESTLWLGTKGAHTPLHSDSYGYNVVHQIHGRKKWVLIPWESYKYLKPTRIPYEESSIYSEINFFMKDISKEEGYCHMAAREVVLTAGDTLLVPPKWWHYVECLDNSLSVNTWVPIVNDSEERVKESIVRTLISFVTQNVSFSNAENLILNPNELDILTESDGEQFNLLKAALISTLETSCYKTQLPTVLLKKGKPVPLVSYRNQRTMDIVANLEDKSDHHLESKPLCKVAKLDIVNESSVDLMKMVPLIVSKNEWTSSTLGHASASYTETSGSLLVDVGSTKSAYNLELPTLFTKAVTHPDVVELISEKLFELVKASELH
ncbi:HSPB1-associated protein 1 homolog isoform X2 [Artemia franciscana]|uniref:HSPB1-associated protein 1 homolog isoform X2 n=1 Tax=Artemia franciscana TaxID=6661 RepID=UPI0032DB0FE5